MTHHPPVPSTFLLRCACLLLAPGVALGVQLAAQHVVTPPAITATLEVGQCKQQPVTLAIGDAPAPQLDVALIIDATGSVKPHLDDVRANVESMIANIRQTAPDAQFAVATFSDYPQVQGAAGAEKFGEMGDYPWQVEQDFSGEVNAIRRALDGIRALGGGDQPEAYLRALAETTTLNWRPNARRIAVLFGDNRPHEPDPGRDHTLGTDDDLARAAVLDSLRRAGISVLAIYSRDLAVEFYEQVAASTGGRGFSLSEADRASQVIEQMIRQEMQTLRDVTLAPAAAYRPWVSWSPQRYESVEVNSTVRFDLRICLTGSTTPGAYQFPIDFVGSGVRLVSMPVTIVLPQPPTGTPTASATPTPSATASATASPSPAATFTPTPTPAPTPEPIGATRLCDVFPCECLLPLLLLPLLGLFYLMRARRTKQPASSIAGPKAPLPGPNKGEDATILPPVAPPPPPKPTGIVPGAPTNLDKTGDDDSAPPPKI